MAYALKPLPFDPQKIKGLSPGFLINGLKREELIASNSMILHELYFAGLGEPNDPRASLTEALTRDFGGFARWRSEFVAMGKAQCGGSGWVILSNSPRAGRLINVWAADNTTTMADGVPILALDMYEHAYHMDFGARAADYGTASVGAINWSNAGQIFASSHRS